MPRRKRAGYGKTARDSGVRPGCRADPRVNRRPCRELRGAPIAAGRAVRTCRYLCVLALLSVATSAFAQSSTRAADSDPTRAILASVRPEFTKAPDGSWRFQMIGRYDRASWRNRRWLGGKRGVLLRAELPLSSANGPSFAGTAGLGDAYAQALLIPHLSGRFAVVAGSGISVPTATAKPLGAGKLILAPVAAPVWILRGAGMMYLKVQQFVSVAGDSTRPDAKFLLVTPTIIHSIGSASWVLVDTETKTDWLLDGKTGVKSGVQFGHFVKRGYGLWVKPEVWWGPNRGGRWNLKTAIVWYR